MNALIHCASRSKTNWAAGLSTHLVEQVGGPWLSSALTSAMEPMTLPEMLDGIYAEKLEEKKTPEENKREEEKIKKPEGT